MGVLRVVLEYEVDREDRNPSAPLAAKKRDTVFNCTTLLDLKQVSIHISEQILSYFLRKVSRKED